MTPTIEVRYENLSVEGDVYVGSRALPTLLNATMNTIEVVFFLLFLFIFSLFFFGKTKKIQSSFLFFFLNFMFMYPKGSKTHLDSV